MHVATAMAATLLRLASTAASLLVLAGFGLFALDEVRSGSETTLARLDDRERPAPGPAGERAREERHGDLREAIDDANDVLLDPFAGTVDSSSSAWVRHGVPALLALLVYGLLLRLLANFIPAGRRHEPLGWDTPR